jgi:serine/threonine protein kinase
MNHIHLHQQSVMKKNAHISAEDFDKHADHSPPDSHTTAPGRSIRRFQIWQFLQFSDTGCKLMSGISSDVESIVESDGKLTAVKTVSAPHLVEGIEWESKIRKTMNHRLVVRYLTQLNDNPSITTEFAVNGSLRNHLSDSYFVHLLKHPTKIAKIIAGIALAMRYVHSKGVIHRNLTPDNILLDWDWNVRIADFG